MRPSSPEQGWLLPQLLLCPPCGHRDEPARLRLRLRPGPGWGRTSQGRWGMQERLRSRPVGDKNQEEQHRQVGRWPRMRQGAEKPAHPGCSWAGDCGSTSCPRDRPRRCWEGGGVVRKAAQEETHLPGEEPVPSPAPAEGLPRGGNSREQAWKQPNTLKSPSTESVKHGSQSPSPAEGGKRAGRQGGVGSVASRHCRASQHHVQEVSQSQGLVTLFLKVRKLQIRMCSLRLVRPSTKLRRTPLRRIWL